MSSHETETPIVEETAEDADLQASRINRIAHAAGSVAGKVVGTRDRLVATAHEALTRESPTALRMRERNLSSNIEYQQKPISFLLAGEPVPQSLKDKRDRKVAKLTEELERTRQSLTKAKIDKANRKARKGGRY